MMKLKIPLLDLDEDFHISELISYHLYTITIIIRTYCSHNIPSK